MFLSSFFMENDETRIRRPKKRSGDDAIGSGKTTVPVCFTIKIEIIDF